MFAFRILSIHKSSFTYHTVLSAWKHIFKERTFSSFSLHTPQASHVTHNLCRETQANLMPFNLATVHPLYSKNILTTSSAIFNYNDSIFDIFSKFSPILTNRSQSFRHDSQQISKIILLFTDSKSHIIKVSTSLFSFQFFLKSQLFTITKRDNVIWI